SLKSVLAEERARLPQVDWSKIKRLMRRDAASLKEVERQSLAEVLKQSKALETLYHMRQELAKVWERSSMKPEQLVSHLQAWCAKAEASGVQRLQDFSLRLRSYA
ncbi:MAG: transposase, partial [Burkholderiales bacterium]